MTSLIQFRMDSQEKQKLESVLGAMGLDCPSAFRMFAAQVIAQRKIPFEIVAVDEDGQWSDEDEKAYKKAKNERSGGEVLTLEEVKRELGL
ncbi:type II toxin-antitoxin system RelB/DinJ family antitoxin [Helicobacter pametensis]|uniref:type II toxin-antitoxin system RelB/DinJ family antitoxin n=1 Tax=Helicobacter pametensis TaxID=95149 RepID=UPI0004B58E7E|nr:type II toxin-antitoxin system RelB/DinJ family antitoxin [Helicobacter pametensis]